DDPESSADIRSKENCARGRHAVPPGIRCRKSAARPYDTARNQQGDVRRMSLFSSWLASSPPDAAIEIAPERVSVAVVGERGGSLVVQAHAFEPLPPGAVVGSLTSSNVHNRPAVAAALRIVLERAGVRPRRAALV